MCRLMRDLRQEGKQIYQVEPFLKILLDIHDFFAEGHEPAEIKKETVQYPVYVAERNATKALLAYYETAMTGSFEETTAATITFARMDAARFRLRDLLRAREIGSLIRSHASTYVEAGAIHYPLKRLLRRHVSHQVRVRSLFLADDALKKPGECGHLHAPGDRLTLYYMFHPNVAETNGEWVLAARSIIYSKIIAKDELTGDADGFPHLRDELACIRSVERLSLDDCRRVFPLVRRANSSDARKIVAEYLAESTSRIRMQPDLNR
jgi:hypothetical protein